MLFLTLSINCKKNCGTETYDWGTFTDQCNGTVKFEGKAGTFGDNAYTAQTLTFMKCSQGQTWNSKTNSCDGTAIRYEFCPTGDNACDNGTILTSGPAYTTCNDLNFAGKTDWRAPTKNELKTLIHCTNKTMPDDETSCGDGNHTSPTVNNLFPNTVADSYWSSSTLVDITSFAWYVDFSYGYTNLNAKTYNVSVRCVRGL